MEFQQGKILPVRLEEEMRRSYLNFAMYVIVDRALPDVRDGLKPVQRRILYTMLEIGLRPDRPFKKSARVVGETMAKYHPHGDSAIYDAMVRMGQDFSYRYPLVEGHGNYGSIDGDPPAAMRYTEARLSRLAMEMLRDIDKDTVNFVPNFDDSLEQPETLPARFPNLLVNGATGIAVGMSTNIPPHNLGEVIDAIVELIDNPDATVADLMKHVKGPDFPTGALILGREGIREAYETGRGRLTMRARTRIEPLQGGRHRIVITEIPYMVNKAALVEKIAQLHHEKKVDGITALRDESDRSGMRIVIELRRDVNPNIVLNQLLKHSQLQETFSVIMLALVNGEPKVLNLKAMLEHYLDYQREVITRRTRFELRRAEERAHILEGYRIALDHIDEIIQLIRNADSDQTAKVQLMERFGLSERQAVAILDMQLRRLTGLEREKIETEYQELLKTIAHLRSILEDDKKRDAIIKDELLEIKEKYNDPRRTEITAAAEEDFDIEDLIAEEDIVITLTHHGYIKRLPVTTYRSQRRGGRGITALSTKAEDFVEHLFITTTHTYVLFFTDRGRVYRLKGHEIPEAGRSARGTAIINLIPIEPGEKVQAAIPVSEFSADRYLFFATRNGVVKKTNLSEYDSSYAGLIAIHLDPDDEVIGVQLTDGEQDILLVTRNGQAIRFSEKDVRPMGRAARGVRGITLDEGDWVVGMDVVRSGADLMVVTEHGYGKRTPLSEYRVTGRAGKGIRTLALTDKNGPIAGVKVVGDEDDIMLISQEGIMIRMGVSDVSRLGRATQGVKLMRLEPNDRVVALAKIAAKDDDGDDE
ncbi:MAG: DNA gyrase subunit A [Firmicutes bacterium]|nr:DNA gyrase subunit A [Bacillota bacterium]MBO2521184.1 DNA gyrase subunit A [Bacillota bacterium]